MRNLSSITDNLDITTKKYVDDTIQYIPYGEVDSTSTSTVFTATVPGVSELTDGTIVMLKNGVVTSASGFTININNLGAKPVYSNMSAATAETTMFNVNYTMLFIYDTDRISGGCWVLYRGYNSNDNTIGYQLRTNNGTLPASDTARYYKIYFTSADGKKFVPASVNSTNNATTARAVNQRPIDPFGRIVYTSASTNFPAGTNLTAATLWSQYNVTFGYSFNRTGGALTLTTSNPVYLKCAPQADGSAIIDATTPYVQSLPTTNDGKIYIFMGIASSATVVELYVHHPVYYHDGNGIKLWTGIKIPTTPSEVGAAASSHAHGNITSGGDITATAPTIANGDQLVINDSSASKITNGPTFDGSTTNKYLSPKGTWENLPQGTSYSAGTGLILDGTTFNHSNSVTAQTTKSFYPITIDAQGHISEYGEGIDIAAELETIYGTGLADVGINEANNVYVTNLSGETDYIFGFQSNTQSATTGISISNHSTGSVTGVQSSTTSVRGVKTGTSSLATASHVKSGSNGTAPTLGTAISLTGVQSTTTTASKVTLGTAKSVPNVTAVGSGSFTQGSFSGGSLTMTMNTTDTKQLDIVFTPATHGADSHTHTSPTLGTAISIPNVTSATDVTVPIKNTNATSIPNVTSVGSASTWAFENVDVPIRADADTTVPIKNNSSTTVVTSASHSVTDTGHTHGVTHNINI